MPSTIRFVIVHYHLFKNAGTTLSAILERNFGGALVYLHGAESGASLDGDDLLVYLEAHRHICVVSSHHLHPPSTPTKGFVFFDVVSLRHPLDRLRSMYDFYHRSPEGQDPFIALARNDDIAGFFRLLLDRYPHLVNNVQVNYFANAARYTRPPDEVDLQAAFDVIRRSAVPIVADSFDVAAVCAEYFLQPAFGTLDFSYKPENVCPERLGELEARLTSLRTICGPRLYDELVSANELDFKLVEMTDAELRRRFHQIPERDERLQMFRNRCLHRQFINENREILRA